MRARLGGVVVDLHGGCRQTACGVVLRHQLVKISRENNVDIQLAVRNRRLGVTLFGDSLHGGAGCLADGLKPGLDRRGQILHLHGVRRFGIPHKRAHHGAAHKGVDHVDDDAGEQDGHKHTAVAEKAMQLLAHNGQHTRGGAALSVFVTVHIRPPPSRFRDTAQRNGPQETGRRTRRPACRTRPCGPL